MQVARLVAGGRVELRGREPGIRCAFGKVEPRPPLAPSQVGVRQHRIAAEEDVATGLRR